MISVGRNCTVIGACRALCLLIACAGSGNTFAADPIPEFYGIYVADDGQLFELSGAEKRSTGNRTPNALVLVFERRSGFAEFSSSIRIARMKYLRNEIELVGKQGLLGPSKDDEKKLTEARGWLSNRRSNDLDIEFRAKPVPGQSEMTYLVPRAPLLPGAYEVLKDGAMVGFFTVQDEKMGDPVDHADFCVDRIRWVNLGGPGFEYVPCNENFGRNVVSTAQGEQIAGRLREHLDRSPPASDEPREQFRDQKLGFGFSYPATFEVQPRNVRHSLIGLTPPNAGVEGTTKAMIFVEVGKTPLLDPNPSVSGIIERQIAATVGNLTGSVVTGPMETTIAGQKAQVFFSSGTRDGYPEEQAITIGVGHKRWMKVNLVVQGGSLDQYLDEYRRVCDSMELF